MFPLFLFAAAGLAFGAVVTEDCTSRDLGVKECLEYVKDNSVAEYPSNNP